MTGCNLTGSSRFSEQDIQAQLPSRIARNAVAPVSNYPQSPPQAQLAAESRPIEMIERLQSGIRLAPLPYDMSQRSQLPGQRNRWPEGQPLRSLGSGIRRDRVSTLEGIGKLGSLEAGSALLPSGLDANQIRQDPASQARSKSAQPVGGVTDGAAAQQVADATAGDEDAESSTYEEGARPGRRLWQTLLLVCSLSIVGICCRKAHVLTQIQPLTCTPSQHHSCCALVFTVMLHLWFACQRQDTHDLTAPVKQEAGRCQNGASMCNMTSSLNQC